MEQETKKTNNIALIIILVLIILGLAGYIVYDKVLSKEEPTSIPEPNTEDINIENDIYDEDYFNELLSTFLGHSNSYMRNIDNFSDEEIASYLYFYYSDYAINNQLGKYSDDGVKITYDVSKKDIDDMALKIFGKKEFNIVKREGRTGIEKIDEDHYQVYWFATGWFTPSRKISDITKTETEAIVTYTLTGNEVYGEEGKLIGELKFYLTKNDDNWNVTKLEYIENK